jgi:hypothetical protein
MDTDLYHWGQEWLKTVERTEKSKIVSYLKQYTEKGDRHFIALSSRDSGSNIISYPGYTY